MSINTGSSEKGYTMIETIMYISILIVLGGVLASYAGKVIARYKTGRACQQIIDLKKAITNFTAADDDYSKLSEEAMSSAKAVPLDMLDLHHSLGGRAYFGPLSELTGGAGINDKYLFYITFERIPRPSCVEILTQGQFFGDGSDMDTLIVNNKSAWRYQHSFYDTAGILNVYQILSASPQTPASIRLNISDAIGACSDKMQNTITWIFS